MSEQKGEMPDPGVFMRAFRSLQLAWRLMLDPRVPVMIKTIPLITAAYVISPIDLIPEMFIPIIGELDDIAAVLLGLRWFIQLCPADVVMEHQQALGLATHVRRDEYVDATYRVVDDDRQR